jgi:membrane protein implicated in regulation of membrane protease activity
VRTLRIVMAAGLGVLVIAGIVLLVADLQIAAFAIFAVAAVLATSWAFYEVGASEDRDREAGRS